MKTRTWVARSLACSVALITAVGLAGSVLAQEHRPGDSVKTMTVRYDDLNLSDIAGARTLYSRIRRAAHEVCAETGSVRGLEAQLLWKGCFRTAVADAVAKVQSPLLDAVHYTSTPEEAANAMLRH